MFFFFLYTYEDRHDFIGWTGTIEQVTIYIYILYLFVYGDFGYYIHNTLALFLHWRQGSVWNYWLVVLSYAAQFFSSIIQIIVSAYLCLRANVYGVLVHRRESLCVLVFLLWLSFSLRLDDEWSAQEVFRRLTISPLTYRLHTCIIRMLLLSF